MSSTEAGTGFGGSGGSFTPTGGGVQGLVTGVQAAGAEAAVPGSEFGGAGGSSTTESGGAIASAAFGSLDSWNRLTVVLGREGPARLTAARMVREATIARLQRLGAVG